MSNFILDNTSLPSSKVDGNGGLPSQKLTASEFNICRQALLDIQSVDRSGGFTGTSGVYTVTYLGTPYAITDSLGQVNWTNLKALLAAVATEDGVLDTFRLAQITTNSNQATTNSNQTTTNTNLAAADGQQCRPGGRLTLTTATPVTSSDVTGITTVFYTPYLNDEIALYNGTSWALTAFTELSQTLADTTKSPAASVANKNYDMFVWNDSGTLRCTRGPAWSSDTARGTGAGTTELGRVNGRYLNANAITNGPAANRGLYVGTIRTDGSNQVNDSLAKRHVWNNYNRVQRPMRALDATATWTYSTASYRQANAGAANQLDFVVGLVEDQVDAVVNVSASGTSIFYSPGIGLDSTTANSSTNSVLATTATSQELGGSAAYRDYPGLGRHFLAWLEYASGTATISGSNGPRTSGIRGTMFG